ncbi:hypothetical protein C8J57DRAFT_650660 [Mycena rebaudengoi]|nr:hypothetical protein C8J57DRAFT_650660 [Mycena rebaudengoi]
MFRWPRVLGCADSPDRGRQMCRNVIDGRSHHCGHFVAISTQREDCKKKNCLFSSQHIHVACKSTSCIRLMAPPRLNPIRTSPMRCPQCSMAARDYP